MKTIRFILISLTILLSVAWAPLAMAETKEKKPPLTCSILPQFLCDSVENKSTDGNISNSGVFQLLKWVIQILTGLVGVVAVGMIIYAGISYSSAGGNAQQVAEAKGMIVNVVIGIVAYAFMFFILNWLIPGGVLGR